MPYLLFTYPNCPKCDALKGHLKTSGLEGDEFSLTHKDSKLKIRDYLKVINRDDTGGIIIPTLVIEDQGEVAAVVNDHLELSDWLRSRG